MVHPVMTPAYAGYDAIWHGQGSSGPQSSLLMNLFVFEVCNLCHRISYLALLLSEEMCYVISSLLLLEVVLLSKCFSTGSSYIRTQKKCLISNGRLIYFCLISRTKELRCKVNKVDKMYTYYH